MFALRVLEIGRYVGVDTDELEHVWTVILVAALASLAQRMRQCLADDHKLLLFVLADNDTVASHLDFLEPFLQDLERQVCDSTDGVSVVDKHLDDLETCHVMLLVDTVSTGRAPRFDNLVTPFPDTQRFCRDIGETGHRTDSVNGVLVNGIHLVTVSGNHGKSSSCQIAFLNARASGCGER